VSLNAVLALVPDRPYAQLVLVDAKRRFGLSELNVGLPELLITPVFDVRAQQIDAFRDCSPIIE
jgi:hypothetical protein